MNTPKNFALQLGALATLYGSLIALVTLLFSVINAVFPDAAEYYYLAESNAAGIRFSIASLVVIFPAYLWLTRQVNNIRRREHEEAYLSLTKWLIYLSLLVGGGVLLGDLIAVLNAFLNGELTTRFLLKAAVLAVVTGAAFFYYLKDAQGYWQTHEKESLRIGLAAIVVVMSAIVIGFLHSETPAEVREARIDDNQIAHLQDMQWRIEDYYRSNEMLPESLSDVYVGLEQPVAPEDRRDYQYRHTGDLTYELCADFVQSSQATNDVRTLPLYEKNTNWDHGAGEWCFEREIDQQYRQ